MMTQVKVKDPFEVNLDCIHCGFCLPKCPTYQVLGNEADSPRGRIYLMKSVDKGIIPLDETVIDHLECCLGCRACETACPSGVRYELMLNATRGRVQAEKPPSWLQKRAFRNLLPYRRRVAWLSRLLRFYQYSGLQTLVRSTPFLARLAPEVIRAEKKLPHLSKPMRFQHFYPAYGRTRHRVGFLSGCVMPFFFAQTHHAAIEVLRYSGCDVVLPPAQGCCGALHTHAGDREMARRLGQLNIQAFPWPEFDAIITHSAGCGAAMKEYEHLFESSKEMAEKARAFSAKVKDICEYLDSINPSWQMRPIAARVAYDDPCHLLHGQQVSVQPRRLLQKIPNLELLSVPNSDRCCGSAGIYNLVRPQMAQQLLEKKIEEILTTNPMRVVTGNPGCLLQIQSGLQERGVHIPVQHPVELLYESMAMDKGLSWNK